MTALARVPLQIVRTGASLGLELARFVERRLRGDGDEHAAAPASAPTTPSSRATATATAPPPPPPPSPSPPPTREPQPEFQEPHIDAEAEEVASFGPEADAGAQVTVSAPWTGYDAMAAQDVVERVRAADDTTKAAVLLYERRGKNRKTVLAAARGGT